jgi:DNA-binding LacI/PurR family transcriptional regulator
MATEVKADRVPKYRYWASELGRQIRTGELRPGERLPSYVEMRQQHNVSQPTLDRVHAILEQNGLIQRDPGRGVFVNSLGARTQKGVLGCEIYGLTYLRERQPDQMYWSLLFSGIAAAARAAERSVLVSDDFWTTDVWKKVDGMIVEGGRKKSEALPDIPVVSLLLPAPGATMVRADNEGGAKAATEYLLSLGHRRIGCLMFTDDIQSRQKTAGYQAALLEAGIEPAVRWQRSLTEPGEQNFDFLRYGEERMTDWLRGNWRELGLTALLCENDQTAIGVLAACRKAGIEVPRDLSVVGFDGTEIGRYTHPALTTVEVPLAEIGRRGIEELLLRIEDEKTPVREIVLPTRLQVRESTAPPQGAGA